MAAAGLQLKQVELENRALRLLICTWNVGNASPKPDELEHWLPEAGGDLDLVVVGPLAPLPAPRPRSFSRVSLSAWPAPCPILPPFTPHLARTLIYFPASHPPPAPRHTLSAPTHPPNTPTFSPLLHPTRSPLPLCDSWPLRTFRPLYPPLLLLTLLTLCAISAPHNPAAALLGPKRPSTVWPCFPGPFHRLFVFSRTHRHARELRVGGAWRRINTRGQVLGIGD